jgi:hypothetical protein
MFSHGVLRIGCMVESPSFGKADAKCDVAAQALR